MEIFKGGGQCKSKDLDPQHLTQCEPKSKFKRPKSKMQTPISTLKGEEEKEKEKGGEKNHGKRKMVRVRARKRQT